MVVAIVVNILKKRFPGCKFVGVGIASVIFCSLSSSSVVP